MICLFVVTDWFMNTDRLAAIRLERRLSIDGSQHHGQLSHTSMVAVWLSTIKKIRLKLNNNSILKL